MNFKARVKSNIGGSSASYFGRVGNVLEVQNGILFDLDGFKWDNDGKYFNSFKELEEYFLKRVDLAKTEFELAEDIEFKNIKNGLEYNLSLEIDEENDFNEMIKNNEKLLYLSHYYNINSDNIHEFSEWIQKVDGYVQNYKRKLNRRKRITKEEIEERLGYKIEIIE